MPSNVDVEERLIQEALAVAGLCSEHEVVELALRTLIALRRQRLAFVGSEIRGLRGKLQWSGNLESMRRDSSRTVPGMTVSEPHRP